MRSPLIVVGDPRPDTGANLAARLECMQVNALVFQGAPQPLDDFALAST